MNERLEAIITRMRLETRGGDPEIAHGSADELLIESLIALATPDTWKQIEQIVTLWRDVPKWYA